jgi:hypothetical protein
MYAHPTTKHVHYFVSAALVLALVGVWGVGKELCNFSDSLVALSQNGGFGPKRTLPQK